MILERVICGCGTPMECTDSSVPVVYNESVVYYGTKFTCPCCCNVFIPITSEQSINAYNFTKTGNTIEVKD